MKEPQLNKQFSDKIKSLLEGYEESYQEGEWEKFSASYFSPRKNKDKKAFYWISGLAASIALGIFFLGLNKYDLSSELAVKDENILLESTLPNFNSNQDHSIVSIPIDSLGSVGETEITSRSVNTVLKQNLNSLNKVSNQELEILPLEKEIDFNASLAEVINGNLTETADSILNDIKLESNKNQNSISRPSYLADDAIKNWLNEGSGWTNELSVSNKQPLKLGLFLTPQAISQGVEGLNFGAGVMSQFSFSKRLKLDLGLAMAKQQINLNPNAAPRGIMVVDFPELTTNTLFSSVINQSYLLSFNHLEIPLNFRYNLKNYKNSDFYLISGVSSMLYFNQKSLITFSTVAFNSLNFPDGSSEVKVITKSVSPESISTNSNNIGALLNLSFGYEQHINKGASFSFEPFYKFSLGEQTFTNQSFGIGGINVRMNFQFKKQSSK
jgi:hypothetical protein